MHRAIWASSPIRFLDRMGLAVIVAAAIASFPATSANAQNTQNIETGNTKVALSSSFLSALTTLKVTAGTQVPTQLLSGVVNFPVIGGGIDLTTAKGQVLHSGGLTLTAGKTEVALGSFIVDTTGSSPVISGLVTVNGVVSGRVTLFDLTLPSTLKVPLATSNSVLELSQVDVKLDAEAASALNSTFGVSAFEGGLDVGTANVLVFLTNEP